MGSRQPATIAFESYVAIELPFTTDLLWTGGSSKGFTTRLSLLRGIIIAEGMDAADAADAAADKRWIDGWMCVVRAVSSPISYAPVLAGGGKIAQICKN